MKRTEADLASGVQDWLVDQGWDVYPEVRPACGWPRADLVARIDGRVWVVECKLSLSLAVIEQADDWAAWCHWRSVAVPDTNRARKLRRGQRIAEKMCGLLGIGVLRVARSGVVQQVRFPVLNRRLAGTQLLDALCEAQKEEGVAGSRNNYFTPFRRTRRDLVDYVREHPGTSMEAAVEAVAHHYRRDTTAAVALCKWVRAGVISEIEWRGHGLFLVDDDPRPATAEKENE